MGLPRSNVDLVVTIKANNPEEVLQTILNEIDVVQSFLVDEDFSRDNGYILEIMSSDTGYDFESRFNKEFNKRSTVQSGAVVDSK